VPRTRAEINRDAKVFEILEATEASLREGGYSAVSVAAIARELGIAHNAIYWYFPSKDHLLVATLKHMIEKMIHKKPKGRQTLVDRTMWFVDQLADLYPIRASMHEHRERSVVIREFLDDFESLLQRMLRNVLSKYIDESELDVATSAFIATVQGSFLQGIPRAERRRILTFSLERLIGETR
jgi:TetR/AcrR family transcriptional regulator, cholesterol catabolism regulator